MSSAVEPRVTVSLQAFHINSSFGNLAAVYHAPEAGSRHAQDLLFIHGFAHEHSIARAVMASIWNRLAADGTGVLSLDLPGCGDSSGDFGDGTWDNWLSGVIAAYRWLEASGGRPLHIAGLRLGAALALESSQLVHWKSILLMQPVLRGEEIMTQFLRMRVAFSGLRGDLTEKETTQKLRARIAAGEKLEIGGFFLAPELAQAIDKLDLRESSPPANPPIHWLETGKGSLPPVANAAIDHWRSHGADVAFTQVDVRPYWVHTRGMVPEYGPLVDEVARILGEYLP
jgi:exosortase A-associated hydrolase 2